MHPAYIQAELKIAGYNQKTLAEELGVSAMTISEVIKKRKISDRLMKAIAEKIGKHHYEVFPEYYFGPKKRSTSKTAAR